MKDVCCESWFMRREEKERRKEKEGGGGEPTTCGCWVLGTVLGSGIGDNTGGGHIDSQINNNTSLGEVVQKLDSEFSSISLGGVADKLKKNGSRHSSNCSCNVSLKKLTILC